MNLDLLQCTNIYKIILALRRVAARFNKIKKRKDIAFPLFINYYKVPINNTHQMHR